MLCWRRLRRTYAGSRNRSAGTSTGPRLPAYEHERVVVRQDQRQHGEHEQVQVSEETVVAAFVRHVACRINVDQCAYAGDKQEPDAGERVEEKACVSAKCCWFPVKGKVVW